mmetsp:Transcript_107138/g.333955  ORF Transcript_107138/g.333955 Transcript_107138/m.333955 type:complete len:219 (-) Transcript_107138:118-774(-)
MHKPPGSRQTRKVWSWEPETTNSPEGAAETVSTSRAWPSKVRTNLQLGTANSLTLLSEEPVATSSPFRAKQAEFTWPLWPRKVQANWPLTRFQARAMSSKETVRMCWPSGEKDGCSMRRGLAACWMTSSHSRESRLQILKVRSMAPVAILFPSGDRATECTWSVWPRRVRRHWPVLAAQILIVPSKDVVTREPFSGVVFADATTPGFTGTRTAASASS